MANQQFWCFARMLWFANGQQHSITQDVSNNYICKKNLSMNQRKCDELYFYIFVLLFQSKYYLKYFIRKKVRKIVFSFEITYQNNFIGTYTYTHK